MKRLLSFCLLLVLFSSCKSPLSNFSNNEVSSGQSISTTTGQLSLNLPTAKTDSLRKAAWQEFQNQNGPKWRIRWNKKTGLPVSIWLGKTKKAYTGTPEKAARDFLADYQTLFGFTNLSQMKYIRTQTFRGISHITFNQTFNDIPVYNAEFKVHIRQDGHVDMANGNYFPNIQVSTTPSVSSSSAGQTAQNDLHSTAKITVPVTSSKLVIYRDQKKQFHLAWKIILSSDKPLAAWLYFVDAQSGHVIFRLNQLTDITGDGDVYPTYPGLTSVTDESFYRLNGNGYLQGEWAYIKNDSTSNAYSSSNSFQYNPEDLHFDEANLYWHIDQYRMDFINNLDNGYLSSYGFNDIIGHVHAAIPVDQYGNPSPNAWFDPDNQQLYFDAAYPVVGTKDFAKEDKVIYHEYGHAVIYNINSGIMSLNNEEGAISEGTPDYLAGSYTGRSKIGVYCCTAINGVRDMSNPQISTYSDYENIMNNQGYVDPHKGGEFFSSILWDLHNNIDPGRTDHLVYDALFRITGSPTFLGFRDAMMAADAANYDGVDVQEIQDTFASKGVLGSTLSVSISGPTIINANQYGNWSANVSGGSGTYTYSWYHRHTNTDHWSFLGNGSTISTTDTAPFYIKVDVIDNAVPPNTGDSGNYSVYIQGYHP